jgi:DNA-binding CsgD family transcriptional regulator
MHQFGLSDVRGDTRVRAALGFPHVRETGMDDARGVFAAAERCYAAAAAPGLWPQAIDAIVELLRARHGFLHVESAGRSFNVHARVDAADVARLYAPEAMRIGAPLFGLIPHGVAVRSELLSDREFARSQAYNELFRPLGGFHSVHLRRPNPSQAFMVSICRGPRAPGFSVETTATLRALEPHIATALALHHRLDTAEGWSASLTRTLDRLETGVILTDAAARPLLANARATRILAERDGLSCTGAALAAAQPRVTQELRRAVQLAGGTGAEVSEQRLRLDRPSGRAPLLLAVAPIWRLDRSIAGLPSARVAVFITESDVSGAIDRTAVTDTFRLTQREADVALLLASGHDLIGVAAELGLTHSTVRSHLKRVFDKTDVHSQAALLALLRGFVAPSS